MLYTGGYLLGEARRSVRMTSNFYLVLSLIRVGQLDATAAAAAATTTTTTTTTATTAQDEP
jgi:hypothetical protein